MKKPKRIKSDNVLDKELFEYVYPIGSIYLSFKNEILPFFEWEAMGWCNGVYMFKRIK